MKCAGPFRGRDSSSGASTHTDTQTRSSRYDTHKLHTARTYTRHSQYSTHVQQFPLIHDVSQHRPDKRSSLARAGAGDTDNVMTEHCYGHSLALDWSGGNETLITHPAHTTAGSASVMDVWHNAQRTITPSGVQTRSREKECLQVST